MIRPGHSRICTIVTLLLIASLTSTVTRADDGKSEQDKPIRLHATALVGPIGTVSSLSAVKINGRALYGEQDIWRGDLIQAPSDTNAHVWLEAIGQITLATGAAMTIAATSSKQDDQTIHRVLIASVIEGEINVRLQPEASAYIETQGSVISADKGASFRLRAEGQNAQVDALIREVHVEPKIQTRRVIAVVCELDPPITGVRRCSLKPIRVRTNRKKGVSLNVETTTQSDFGGKNFMPTQNEPAKNIPVKFTLEPFTLGQLDPQETLTNDLGIADTTFTAGPNEGKGKVIATAVFQQQEYRFERDIVVSKQPGIFSKRNILIAAGAIGAIIIICCARPNGSQKQDPPIVIEP